MLWEIAKRDLLYSIPEFAQIDKKKELDDTEIIERYLPLIFIKIGIEALIRYEDDSEHAYLGRKVFDKEIEKYLKKYPY